MSNKAENWVKYQELNLSEVDELVRSYKEARDDYDAKKKVANEADAKVKEFKQKILDVLAASGKKKYFADDIGTVSVVESLDVHTPKTIEDKQALFNWIKDKYGDDVMVNYQSFNAKSLKSFVNKEYELAGKPSDFKLPGLEEPTISQNLTFRKAK